MLFYNVNYLIIYNFIIVCYIIYRTINIKMSGYVVLSYVYNSYNFYELQAYSTTVKNKHLTQPLLLQMHTEVCRGEVNEIWNLFLNISEKRKGKTKENQKMAK